MARELVNSIKDSRENYAINGSFDFWQRATSGVVNQYIADRWYHYGGPNVTLSRVSSGLINTEYAMRLQRDNGTATTGQNSVAGESLEFKDVEALRGKKVTIQFKYRTGAGITGDFNFDVTYSTTANQRANIIISETSLLSEILPDSASFVTVTRTVDLPASALGFGIHFGNYSTTTAGANDYVDIAEVMIVSGGLAAGNANIIVNGNANAFLAADSDF